MKIRSKLQRILNFSLTSNIANINKLNAKLCLNALWWIKKIPGEIKKNNTDINNIVIRGVSTPSQTNNPLYVMNGEVVNNNYLKVLSPNNIESINVLKGEKATALYGSKAANGVMALLVHRRKRVSMR